MGEAEKAYLVQPAGIDHAKQISRHGGKPVHIEESQKEHFDLHAVQRDLLSLAEHQHEPHYAILLRQNPLSQHSQHQKANHAVHLIAQIAIREALSLLQLQRDRVVHARRHFALLGQSQHDLQQRRRPQKRAVLRELRRGGQHRERQLHRRFPNVLLRQRAALPALLAFLPDSAVVAGIHRLDLVRAHRGGLGGLRVEREHRRGFARRRREARRGGRQRAVRRLDAQFGGSHSADQVGEICA